jgi:hypothetical protein
MFSIGVGSYYEPEVLALASEPKDRFSFELETADDLPRLVDRLSYKVGAD